MSTGCPCAVLSVDASRMPEANFYSPVVEEHRRQLAQRPALREVYAHYAERMRRHLSSTTGLQVELGTGAGPLAVHFPDFLHTDAFAHEGADRVVDACAMPFQAGEVANLLAVDVLHHLPEPSRFFSEVDRVLVPGGRLVLLEPYISPGSWPLYALAHHEPVRLRVDPFRRPASRDPSGGPCNQAAATLAFGRHRRSFEARWPRLRVQALERSDGVVYPLTGGYSRPSRIPAALVRRLLPLEDMAMRWLGGLFAARLLVVLERAAP